MKEQNKIPFSPLDIHMVEIGLTAQQSEDSKNIILQYPVSDISEISFPKEMSLYSELQLKIITKEDFSGNSIILPADAYNFSNFSPEIYKDSGEDSDDLMPTLQGIYDRISLSDPKLQKNQLCFSSTTNTVYILPTLLNR